MTHSQPHNSDERVFLSALHHEKGLRPEALVGVLGYNLTRVGNVLNRLRKKGYVQRIGSFGYRNIKYQLTPKGLRATGRVTPKGKFWAKPQSLK